MPQRRNRVERGGDQNGPRRCTSRVARMLANSPSLSPPPRPPPPQPRKVKKKEKPPPKNPRKLSKITGKPFSLGTNIPVKEIATEPFAVEKFPMETWIEIFKNLDAFTATVFKWTCKFGKLLFEEYHTKLYDPQATHNPEKPFPVPLDYDYHDARGRCSWLRLCILPIMIPSHVWDPLKAVFRRAEYADRVVAEMQQECLDRVQEIRTKRREEAKARSVARKEDREERGIDLVDRYEELVERVREENETRAERRIYAMEQLAQLEQNRHSDNSDNSEGSDDEMDRDDISVVSSDADTSDSEE
ncbi:hypothetical protein HYALB_00007364 [Hymenoscyphus albidus]|uniref:F-box domain-containing protein n=1 Tax=Hymenoscyphus albidus TaxID=595503 RepID=A0A9N9LKE9_9HELO|nr:hypothetical protein HYALB_00007364 [Hymenoscyphus albidus]